jgi:hypothetical protein
MKRHTLLCVVSFPSFQRATLSIFSTHHPAPINGGVVMTLFVSHWQDSCVSQHQGQKKPLYERTNSQFMEGNFDLIVPTQPSGGDKLSAGV